jgi:putative hydrolase of the HAD superfamily
MALRARQPAATTDDVQQLHDIYRQHEPSGLALFEDGAFALEHYARQGDIGLITDGHLVMQSAKVRGLGIGPRFRQIIYTDTLAPGRSMAKPHPRAFELMRDALGAAGDRFVYIGDNPAKDFVSPNTMGWTSVWVDRPGGIHHGAEQAPGGSPQHTIRSLRQLPEVLGA